MKIHEFEDFARVNALYTKQLTAEEMRKMFRGHAKLMEDEGPTRGKAETRGVGNTRCTIFSPSTISSSFSFFRFFLFPFLLFYFPLLSFLYPPRASWMVKKFRFPGGAVEPGSINFLQFCALVTRVAKLKNAQPAQFFLRMQRRPEVKVSKNPKKKKRAQVRSEENGEGEKREASGGSREKDGDEDRGSKRELRRGEARGR